jgi:glutamate carboxypeptidase
VLLLGHLDTVFENGSAVPLWERQGDRVRGQGVNDMKGGDVIMIEAPRGAARTPTTKSSRSRRSSAAPCVPPC